MIPMKSAETSDIDADIATFPQNVQEPLQQIRALVREVRTKKQRAGSTKVRPASRRAT
jgi:hypothetical protein